MLEFLYYNYMSGESDFCFCNTCKHTEKITSRYFGMLNNNNNSNNNNKL